MFQKQPGQHSIGSMQDPIMRNGYYNVVATVLLVMNFERTRSVEDLCGLCPAGTFCGKSKNQTCIPCPSNSYSSTGGQRACNICTKCEGYHRVKKPCSFTSDTECDCISGFHCLGAGCAMCDPDCKPGQELTADGCKDCDPGTFNDQEGGVCRPWTNCSLDGKSVREKGTKDSDVVCGPALPNISPGNCSVTLPVPVRVQDSCVKTRPAGTHPKPVLPLCEHQVLTFFLALTSAAAVFLLIFLMLRLSMVKWSRKKFLYLFKQPFIKPVQTAQEEDACSCRFPEEEEGGCEL
uniref:tumor necrosis factor receptor superfamily member 9 n=1 Tax=Ictidomys tridecemlineatus TaxID=43179 RepID=UPI001A9D8BE0|nr:tumor necrosis factor receptor superfamily member 9 [Ictidomys tridecemlineatus]